MIKLEDGPAAGAYAVKRAPLFLRGVVDRQSGDCDVLDMVEDTPAETENVFVYRRVGQAGHVHINRGAGRSGFYASATYVLMPEVDGDHLRGSTEWQEWATDAAVHVEEGR